MMSKSYGGNRIWSSITETKSMCALCGAREGKKTLHCGVSQVLRVCSKCKRKELKK